jgi:hypothetical protein
MQVTQSSLLAVPENHPMLDSQTATPGSGAYEHVLVVMSIVLGLAVTQLLKGAAQLYRSRGRVRTYWLHWGWTALLVVFSLLLWWTYWNYRSITEWNFIRFVLYLSPVVAFYFLSSIAFPDPAEGVVDLRSYYFSNRTGFFGTFAAYAVLAGLTAMVVRGLPVLDPSNFFRVGMVLLMLVAMRSSSARVHAVLFAVAASLLLAFIVLFQFRLG